MTPSASPAAAVAPAPPSTTRLVARGALGGVAGGLLAGLVGLVVAWPALDAAVAVEQAAQAAHAAAGLTTGSDDAATGVEEVVVSRTAQRLGGLTALVVVGAVLGAALAVVQRATAARAARHDPSRPATPVFRRCLQLGTAVLVALVVVPQLRYPALPPGASATGGDYLAALLLGVGVVAAYLLVRSAARERGVLAPLVEVGLGVAAVLLVLLGASVLPDRGAVEGLPPDLLWDFRVGAIAVQVALVTATAALVGVFLDLDERRAAQRRQA